MTLIKLLREGNVISVDTNSAMYKLSIRPCAPIERWIPDWLDAYHSATLQSYLRKEWKV